MSPKDWLAKAKPELEAIVEPIVRGLDPEPARALLLQLTTRLLAHIDALGRRSPGEAPHRPLSEPPESAWPNPLAGHPLTTHRRFDVDNIHRGRRRS